MSETGAGRVGLVEHRLVSRTRCPVKFSTKNSKI